MIGEAPGDPGPEFVVVSIERRGWFSADLLLAARYAFTRRMDGMRRFGLTAYCGLDCEISFRQGETLSLLLPRRFAEPGRLVAFEEVAENPAFEARWVGVERE